MIIITGGAGFIGSCLVSELNSAGRTDILIVDHLGSSDKWKNLVGKGFSDVLGKAAFREQLRSASALPKTDGAKTDGAKIDGAKIDAIVHLGACSSTTERDADYLLDNNFRYSREVAQWALANGARFIYASSGATYGDGELGYDDDDTATLSNRPLNMYGYSKQLFDEWVLREKLQSSIVGLKFFNVYGPNEYHKGEMASVVYKQFPAARDSKSVKLFRSYAQGIADGEQKRDFIYVKDCTKIIRWFLTNPSKNGIFNVGTGKARSWKDLATSIYQALGKAPLIEYVDMPKELIGKYQYFTEAKMSKLQQSGFTEPFSTLEEGVKDYVTNYLVPGAYL